jgi:DNA-binding MarR family transcriptional regulator
MLALTARARKDELDEDRERYVEEFGVLFGQFGLPRMVGRLLGALLVSDPPERTAEELAGVLRASRGSISSATRSLVQMGLVERQTKPGERRDYFRVKPGAWNELMHRELEALSTFRRMAERGLGLMDSGNPEAKRGLEEMRDLYAYWEKEFPAVLARWEKER